MNKVVIPCNCGCSIVVIIEFDEFEDNPQEFFAEFYTAMRPNETRRSRLLAAWRVLRGRDPWLHDVCWDADAVKALHEFLNRTVKY